MQFSLELPLRAAAADPANVTALAQAAERAGFAMVGYTDHPAPSSKWLAAGGHPTLDPFAGLSFVAAVTARIGLMTYLAVLPYRNPLMLAKSVATVDRLSAGRFTLVAGTGYLRSEFAALGRSFEDRNDLFDEAVEVIRSVYVSEDFRYEGQGFSARGVAIDPKPVQIPHPPIWIGGSSRASRERVARYGSGWAPLAASEAAARTVRSAPLTTDADLARAIDDLRGLLQANQRDPATVSVQLDGALTMVAPAPEVLRRSVELERLGVSHALVRPPDGPVSRQVEELERFGSEVIAAS
jgi:probable F420-dependent oxidoreductase